MRDDELRRILTDANPWWRAAVTGADPLAWISSHRLLRERARYDLGYRPTVLQDIATGPVSDLLVVLAGPRRVGKSVTLIDTVAALCARADVDTRQIIHVPCDGMRERDLRRVLTLGRELTRSVDLHAGVRRVWLLDEISTIPGWTAVLKAARDGTDFGDDTVVATGSRWLATEDLTGSLLTGRAGTSPGRRVRQLLPMTFRDYLAATRPQLLRIATQHPAFLQAAPVADRLEEVRFDIDAYDLAWQDYLTCGGFPRAVAEHSSLGGVSDVYLHDLLAWLRRDVDIDAPPESVPLLLQGLAQRATSPLNATRTAQALGYATRQAFDRRLTRLTSTFAALPCPQRGPDGALVPGSQAKLYFTDPIIAWLPSTLRAGVPAPDMTALTEMALGVSLARTIDDLEEGRWLSGDTIGYLRTPSGTEVDLAPVAVPTSAGSATTTAMESKWVDARWRSEARTVEGQYAGGILATKSLLDLEHPAWAVPAPLMALMLG
jgi:predicted AAA+ superfamily ATPase